MVAVPFPLSSFPGRNPQESGGRLINCYAEPLGDTARAKGAYHRSAGLTLFGTTPATGFRGMIQAVNILYAVWDSKVYRFTSAGGTGTLVSNFTGTDKCFLSRNNKAGTPDVVLVSPGDGAFLLTSSTVTNYPDADLPPPCDVGFLEGYFVFAIEDGRMFASGINSTTVNSLDFATAEAKSDKLLRGVVWDGQYWAMGERSVEIWSSAGGVNATGFPFNRLTTIQEGLIGRYAIAGHEDGFGKALAWVGADSRVKMVSAGYNAQDISPPDLDRLIEAVADKNTLEASVYVSQGRPMWVLSSDDWTWEFNFNSQKWNERASYAQSRWRGRSSGFAFNRWLTGDTESGNIYQIDGTSTDEGGDPLTMVLESGPLANFPNRVKIPRIDVDATVGVGISAGNTNQRTPSIEIAVSRNGGLDWDNPRILPLGPAHRGEIRLTATRFGLSGPGGPRVRLSVADGVDCSLMGADIPGVSVAK